MTRNRLTLLAFAFVLFVCASGEPSSEVSQSQLQKLEAFTRWVDDNGFERNFDLAVIPGQGVGGVARKNLTASDVLLRVPKDKLISNNKAKDVNGWQDWKGYINSEPLMIWVLRERLIETSPFKPYLDILPESFETHPLMWEPSDFAFANGTRLASHCQQLIARLTACFQHTSETLLNEQPDLFPAGYFTWQRYLWSFLAVNTRAWSSGENDLILVPLADMLNHRPEGGPGGVVNDFFTINSTLEYVQGAQVYDNYGPKGNFDLLVGYGFVLNENPFTSTQLRLSLRPDTNLMHSLIAPLVEAKLPSNKEVTVQVNTVPHDLLRMFRLSTIKFSEIDKVHDALEYKAISVENEVNALRQARLSLKQLIAAYPSDEEELAIFQRPDLTYQNQAAIKLRVDERKALESAVAAIEAVWHEVLVSGQLIGGLVV